MEISDLFSKYHKRIEFNYNKEKFLFDVNQSLFSSAHIDKGTFQLIDSLRKNSKINYNKILDIGCGYGAIGIVLKKLYPESEITCTDRDALALKFTRHNSKLNNCKIKTLASLDYSEIDKKEKFNLIVCNYPAKLEKLSLKKFIFEASKYLNKKGIFAIVIVKELLEDFQEIIKDKIEKENISIVHEKKSSGHYVFHLKFKKELDMKNKEIYTKEKVGYYVGETIYKMETSIDLPEQEFPRQDTLLVIDLIKNIEKVSEVSIIEPFQGHLVFGVEYYLFPQKINIISRDLLSLKTTEKNLKNNGFKNFELSHEYLISNTDKEDLLIWRIEKFLEIQQFKRILQLMQQKYHQILLIGNKKKLTTFIRHSKPKLKILNKKEQGNFLRIYL